MLANLGGGIFDLALSHRNVRGTLLHRCVTSFAWTALETSSRISAKEAAEPHLRGVTPKQTAENPQHRPNAARTMGPNSGSFTVVASALRRTGLTNSDMDISTSHKPSTCQAFQRPPRVSQEARHCLVGPRVRETPEMHLGVGPPAELPLVEHAAPHLARLASAVALG